MFILILDGICVDKSGNVKHHQAKSEMETEKKVKVHCLGKALILQVEAGVCISKEKVFCWSADLFPTGLYWLTHICL